MTPDARRHKIDQLFAKAVEQSPHMREALLQELCAGLPEDILLEVRQLLEADAKAEARRFLHRELVTLPPAVSWSARAGPSTNATDGSDIQDEPSLGAPENEPTQGLVGTETASAGNDCVSARVDDSAGDTISFAGGRYRVNQTLGQGGQKQVYLAADIKLGRDVVVAVIRHDTADSSAVERMNREAQTLARLGEHPHIVGIFDWGEEDNQTYIVMQFVDGGSVADRLRKREMTLTDMLRIAQQTCEALDYAHKHGIVHRDVKPANIWLTRGGEVKVGDFGIAASVGQARLTGTGLAVGTAIYVSPEQALGGDVGPCSDLYSLGVVLYEMLTGRPPFEGDNVLVVISKHQNAVPVPPSWKNPEVSDALDTLVLQLLSKRPEQRPSSAAAVQETLETISVRLSRPGEKRPRVPGRRPLNRLGHGVFVGRKKELEQLRESLEQAIAGSGQVVMLMGDPGSGKSRTAEELVTYARIRGVEVHRGNCHEEQGAPAFWPWIHIIRSCAQVREPHLLGELMGSGAVDIASLDREIAALLPTAPNAHRIDSQEARFRLFDAATTFLGNACKENPCLVVLDDLHWADEPSLRLLSYLAAAVSDKRLMVLGTYRDVSLDHRHPLARTLGELAGKTLHHRICLPGLSEEDVGEFITGILGVEPPRWLVTNVWENTEGNPFFVSEMVRLLVAEGYLDRLDDLGETLAWSVDIPQVVRDVILRRFQRLSQDCERVLRIASAVGRTVGLDVLERLSELPEQRLLDVLDEAVSARLLEELPGSVIRYSFTHALVRETLYEGQSKARRTRLHGQIARILADLYGEDPGPQLSELAHHFFKAAQGGEIDQAILYCERAAKRSLQVLAFEEAVRYYNMALEALQLTMSPDKPKRYELLLAIGEARNLAGQHSAAIDAFEEATRFARELNLPEQFAQAAWNFAQTSLNCSREVAPVISLLEESVRATDEADSTAQVRVLAEMSRALGRMGLRDEATARNQLAVEMARRMGDGPALAYALFSHIDILLASHKFEEAHSCASEMLRAAEDSGDFQLARAAHMWRMVLALSAGDKQTFETEFEAHDRLTRQERRPLHMYHAAGIQAMQAILEGRFADAERLAVAAASMGKRMGAENADGTFGMQMFTIRREQGRLSELAPALKRLVHDDSPRAMWRPGLALIYAELGSKEQAQSELNCLAADDFASVPRDALWLVCMSYLAEVCALLNDWQRAAVLYRLLAPCAERNVVAGDGVVCYGAVSRYLGQLASTMSRWDNAELHFQHAMSMNREMGATPWLAHAEFEYAKMLFANGRTRDRKRAEELLEEANEISRGLQMRSLSNRIIAARESMVTDGT